MHSELYGISPSLNSVALFTTVVGVTIPKKALLIRMAENWHIERHAGRVDVWWLVEQ